MKRRTLLAAFACGLVIRPVNAQQLRAVAAALSGFAAEEIPEPALRTAAAPLRRIAALGQAPVPPAWAQEALLALYAELCWQAVPFAARPGQCPNGAWHEPWTTS